MKQNSFLIIASMFSLTLVTGISLTLYSFEFFLFFGVLSALSFYFLNSLNKGEDFFRTNKFDEVRRDGGILVTGAKLISQKGDDEREDRFLEHFTLTNLMKRRIYGMIISVTALVIMHFILKTNISAHTLIPFLVFYLIINVSHVGQLLVPLFLNAALVAICHEAHHAVGWYLLYTFMAFFTMVLISSVKDDGHGKKENLLKDRKAQWRFFGVIIFFFVIVMCATQLLPDKLKLKINPQLKIPPQLESSAHELTQQTVSALQKMKTNLGELPPTPKNIELSEKVTDLISKAPVPLSGSSNSEKFPEGGHFHDDPEGFTKESEQLAQEYDQYLASSQEDLLTNLKIPELTESSGKGLTQDEIQQITGQLNDQASDKKLTEDEERQIEKARELMKGKILSEIDRGAMKETLSDLNALNEKRIQLEKVDSQKKIEEMKSQGLMEKVVSAKEKLREEKQNSKNNAMKWWEKLTEKWFVFVAIGIILYFRRRLKKKGIETVETTEVEAMPELRAKWKELRQKKYTPREEVIHYYNLFHESMQKIHYNTHEAPPSCIIHANLKEFNPVIDRASYALTEIYAQCFYGNKNVHAKALNTFRKAMQRITQVYGLT